MTSSSWYWDRIAERYAKRPIKNFGNYLEKLDITQSFLKSDMHVLEFGCGTGGTALEHASKVKSYRAIDSSANMIDQANRRLGRVPAARNVHFEVSTIEQVDPRSNTFDAILGLNVLHLIEDPRSTLEQIYQLLNPGGLFICSTACLKDKKAYLKPILAITHKLQLTPRVSFFSKSELISQLEKLGFCLEYSWVPLGAPDELFLVLSKPN